MPDTFFICLLHYVHNDMANADSRTGIFGILDKWSNHCKILTKQLEDREMDENQSRYKWNSELEKLNSKRSEQDYEENGRMDEERSVVLNIEDETFRNEKSDNTKGLAMNKFQYPALVINIRRKCALIKSFSQLSVIFQDYLSQCCNAFHKCSNNYPQTETLEHCAAVTYAIVRLLFHIGYNPETVAVSGLDTLIMLAAKNAIKLEEACFAWKSAASLMQNNNHDLIIATRITEMLMQLDINFQNAASLINVHQLTLSDVESLTVAILTNDEQNQHFLKSTMENYVVFGTINDSSAKHIEKFDDFVTFIAAQKGCKFPETLRFFNQKKQESQFNQSEKSLKQNISEIFSVHLSLKQNKYLFNHLVHNYNILSAATLLTEVHSSLSKKVTVLDNVTFLSPVIFTPENEIINLKIEISTDLCSIISAAYQCVTFRLGGSHFRAYSETGNILHEINGVPNVLIENDNTNLVSEEEFYTEMEQYHYQYRGEFRSVRKLMIQNDISIVELKAANRLDTLIDGAMQAIVFCSIQQYGTKSVTLVPFHIQKMEIVNIVEEANPIMRYDNAAISAIIGTQQLQNGQLLGSFELQTDQVFVAAYGISFHPITINSFSKSLENEVSTSSINLSQPNYPFTELPIKSKMEKSAGKEGFSQDVLGIARNFTSGKRSVCIKSVACRLPKTVHDLAEFWDALKTGQIMASKIPCSRINGRDNLACGQYGYPIKCANFLSTDISHFDAAFFGISRSEAEKIDPQQRILLECVYECMENAGLTSLHDTGFFVGFMSNEYPDIVQSRDAISMLGSSASIVSGRLNYLFGSMGPAITIDTACSSSLIALQTAMHALIEGNCTTAIVAGVNLILTEQSIGQRANGNLLADDGMCRSFDERSSGYGRADGCVTLLLSINDDKSALLENDNYLASIISTSIGHNGQSISLTAPNGLAQEKLLRECLKKIGSDKFISYWEAHGTGTIIGDAIELKALQANLQQSLISTVKTHFGHPEATAGNAGLAKILVQFKYKYIPEHGSYQFLRNFQEGNVYLPVIGEEWKDSLAGISSFGISGTNAMAILQSKNSFIKSSQRNTTKWHTYICPISAKSKNSLNRLVIIYQTMLKNTFQRTENICAVAALHRNHMQYRSIIFLQKGKIVEGRLFHDRLQHNGVIGLELFGDLYLPAISCFYSTFPKFRVKFNSYFHLMRNFAKQQISMKYQRIRNIIILAGQLALIAFLFDAGIKIAIIYPNDKLSMIAAHLITGKLKFTNFDNVKIPIVYSNIQIFSQKITRTNDCGKLNCQWYRFCTTRGQKMFEYELLVMIAKSYLQGDTVDWTYLYSLPSCPITLPNYQFERESFWITTKLPITDHWLIGRLMKAEENEWIFINQISRITTPKLMLFKYNGQIRFSFGICCEAIIEALQLIFPNATDTKYGNYFFKDITIVKYLLQENDWIKTTIKKYTDVRYSVRMTCASDVIFSTNIMLSMHATLMKTLDVAQIGKPIGKPNFYEILKDKGIQYETTYQTVTSASSDEKNFVAKYCCHTYLVVETLMQVAYYHGLLNPHDIYDKKKFTIKNLYFCKILSHSIYVRLENSKIVAYNENGNGMISVRFKKIYSKIKIPNETKYRKSTTEFKPIQVNYSPIIYQNYVDKVKHAVEDIRKDSIPLRKEQLSVSFTELGLDSLAITDLANRLNTIYFPTIQIGTVDLFNYSNVYSLTDAICAQKFQSISTNCGDEDNSHMMDSFKQPSDISTLRNSRNENNQNKDKHSIFPMRNNENYAYEQVFVKEHSKNCDIIFTITDKEHRSDNELSIIVNKRVTSTSKVQDDSRMMLLWNIRKKPENFKNYFSSNLNDHKVAMIRFELTGNFSLRYLSQILLHLIEVITKSQITWIFSSKPGFGKANAFALGFAKSLSAEFYPKVQYQWNFVLKKISNLKKYLNESFLHEKNEKSEERWLITGGLGGIGWQMAKFIVYNRNVTHLILLGRREPTEEQINEMDQMRDNTDVDVRSVSVDLTSKTEMTEFFSKLQITLTGIIHSAGCIHDALASKQSFSTFRLVAGAKCDGLLILEKLSRKHPVKNFIVNSSVSAIIGNHGQCNYSAANAFADELMLERQANGLPATIINWGNWLETGMAVRANNALSKIGLVGLKTSTAMAYLQVAIDYAPSRMIVIHLNVRKILQHRADLTFVFLNTAKDALRFGRNQKQISNQRNQWRSDRSETDSLVKWNKYLKENNEIDKTSDLKVKIIKTLEEITGQVLTIKDYHRSFMDLGLDSFKIYRFVSGLMKKITVVPPLNVLSIFEHPTVEKLSRYIESLSHNLKEEPEETAVKESFASKIELNFENIRNNFAFFILHSNVEKKLEEKKLRYLNLLDQSSKILERLQDNQSYISNRSNGYLKIVWGSKRKILRNNLLHFKTIRSFEQPRKTMIVCFMISGQGSQIWNMGRQLSYIFPFFRQKFDEILNAANRYMPHGSVNLQDIIYQWRNRKLLYKTEYAQPIIYCFAYSLAKFYEFCGVYANYFVGHSIGELVACTLAGRITVDDGLKLAVKRGQILRQIEGTGKMIAVRGTDAATLQRYSEMSRAAENSDKQVVLSGDNQSSRLCLHFAQQHHYPVTVIDSCYPFHSSIIDDAIVDQYQMECRNIKLRSLNTKNIISNCSGKFMNNEMEAIAPINSTVHFRKCLETLRDSNTNIWLEIGNGEILSTLTRSVIGTTSNTLICSAIRNNIDSEKSKHSLERNIEKKLISMKENDLVLIEQHLINGKIALPAAFIIAKFSEFIAAENCSKGSPFERNKIIPIMSGRVIIFDELRLERRVNEFVLTKLLVKFISRNLILTDNDKRYCSCRLGDKDSEKMLKQTKKIRELTKFYFEYEELKRKMHQLSPQEFYETMRSYGLQYGPTYQILREIYYKDGYIGAKMINANDLIRLIDGALQLLSAALFISTKASVYIPFAIDNILIKYDYKTDRNSFNAYGIISEPNENIVKGSVVIYQDDNEVIILHNVTAIDIGANKANSSNKHCDLLSDLQYSSSNELSDYIISDKNDRRKKHVRRNVNNNNADNGLVTEIKQLSLQSFTQQIEIISYAGIFPGSAVDCASLWNNLKTGTASCSPGNIQKFRNDITMFSPEQFGITPKEAAYIDPQQRILLELVEKTLEKAGIKNLDSETGVFIGASSSDFAQKANAEIQNTCSYLGTGTNQSTLAGRIAYWLNLKGPAMVIDTACSSFFAALVVACDSIKMGYCKEALVGAVNVILNPKPTSVLEKAQMLSKTGSCKVFDVDADGYVRSEGAAIILIRGRYEKDHKLKSKMTSAIYSNDLTFTIESYAMGHNGRSNGLTVPSGFSEYELISRAIKKNTDKGVISWVEAHAAGTALGDPIETEAIVKAAGKSLLSSDQLIHITSIKSSIGHCEAAAGAASLIMILEAYRHCYRPPMQHFKLLNQNIRNHDDLIVPVVGEELPDTFDVLINSFGFTGTNVSVVLKGCNRSCQLQEKHKESNNAVGIFRQSPCILLCSSVSENLENYLQNTSDSLAAVCVKLQHFRSNGRNRTAALIRRHTQKWISRRVSHEPKKWIKVVFDMGKSLEPSMIAEMCLVYRSFRCIFMDYSKIYKFANSLASNKSSAKLAFQFIAKLSLISFLLSIGINPVLIIATNRTDQTVAEMIKQKWCKKYVSNAISNSSKIMPYQCCNFAIRQNIISEDYDCVINVETLRIQKPEETVYKASWKQSFCDQFADTICQLYEHFIDINWSILNDQLSKTCSIPEPKCSKKKYWPFVDNMIDSINHSSSNDKFPFTNLQLEKFQKINKTDKTIITEDLFSNNTSDTIKSDSIYHDYLYELVQKKCPLPNPERITSFIAINLTDTTTIIGEEASFITAITDIDNDIAMLKKQLDSHKCRKLVLEWLIDDENLLENTIRQSILVLNLWKILMTNDDDDINTDLSITSKSCLIIFAIKKFEMKAPFAPCSALLKTLAMEKPTINFKCIFTNSIDKQLLNEILDEKFLNEIIYYDDSGRYVERVQQLNNYAIAISGQMKSANRILITGNIHGIAWELVETLKPNLAVITSRSASNRSSNRNGITIITVKADCTDYQQMEKIFAKFASFDAIFHCAATISNSLMENMNPELFEMVCRPKILGLQNIIKLSKLYQVQKIIAFSSAATILGSAGQANYVVANELMEYVMRKNVPDGLCISWGPWNGRGLLADEQMTAIRKQIQNTGWKLLQAEQVAQLCSKLLSSTGHHIVMDVNFNILRKRRPYLKNFLENILPNNIYKDGFTLQTGLNSNLESDKDLNEIIKKFIREITAITDVKSNVGFMSMGMDSLMIAEMQALLNEQLNLNLSVATLYEYCTVETLSQHIAKCLPKNCESQHSAKMKDTNDNIAVVGYSGAFSGSTDDGAFWRSLLNAKELIETDNYQFAGAIGVVPDTDKFDYRFWKMSPSDASYIDPQIRKFVEHAYIALERCGLARFRNKLRIAVVAGAEPSIYRSKSRCIGGIEDLYEINQKDFVATWTSHLLNLHGPSFGVYSACSTALVAIIQAQNLLQTNQCDAAIAGAVSLAIPETGNYGTPQGMILSSDGHCRPFDHKSNGTVRGSAVGVVVLRRLSETQQSNNTSAIMKIIGYAISNDGLRKSSFMAPNISGQRNCIKEAIMMCGTNTVDYIECHGTGTVTGDLIELTAMSQLYPQHTIIGSVKANIGHALAGAGIASIIKLCKMAEMKIIPKQINFEKLNENLKDVNFTVTKCNIQLDEKKQMRFAANASGIGGTNAHIILEGVDNNNDNESYSESTTIHHQQFYALTISGRTEGSCIQLCYCIADYLKSEMNLAQIASTLQNYREHFEYRIGVSVKSVTDAIKQLKNVNKVRKMEEMKAENVAFYFAPQGLEYPHMGLQTMTENEIFRQVVYKCSCIASNLIGFNFQTIIMNPEGNSDIEHHLIMEQPYSQIATFIICFALVEQLQEWGIEASTMIGHSLGEYVAAAQADVFDLETALKILYKRGCLIARTEKAKMLAVKNTTFVTIAENVRPKMIPEISEMVEVTAVLRPDLICLVGKPRTIEELREKFAVDEVECRELTTSYGFHSSFMDEILDEFAEFLKNFTFRKPKKRILSNIDGKPIEHFDGKYMVKHMRSTIRIDKCIKNLHKKIKVVIEIGPKGIFESLVKDNLLELEVIPTLPSKKQHEKGNDTGNLLAIATKLWTKGYELNWQKIIGNYGFDRLLPNYQFEKDICWEQQTMKWNAEIYEVKLYQPCWVPHKFTFRRQLPKGVLLFMPNVASESISKLLTVLRNLFIPVECVFNDTSLVECMNVMNGNIYINTNKQESYQQLANFLCDTSFYYDSIIHAWNFPSNDELELNACDESRVNDQSCLLTSFYSVYWILKNVVQNATDLRLLVTVDCKAEPEIFTMLGPVRELAMTRPLTQAACILCTPEIDLFEALHLFTSYQADFSFIRNPANGYYEYFSYQSFRSDKKYFGKNRNCSVEQSDNCLVQDDDIIVLFGGFGSIGQSFINVLCRSFNSLTIYVASLNATHHFQKIQDKIKQWQVPEKHKTSGKVNLTNANFQSERHKIFAYDIDIRKEDEMRYFLTQIMLRHGRINVVIHSVAGNSDSTKFEKTFDEIQFVLEPKIRGVRNIINILHQNNINIRWLILNSSMNALFGFPGNSDYAASNAFLDAFCGQNYQNISNITSIQWSGWKDSTMFSSLLNNRNRSRNPIADLIVKYSLTQEQAESIIQKCLYERGGLIAVSIVNPNQIVQEIHKLNFENNNKFATMPKRQEKESNDLRSLVGKIWMKYLGVEQVTLDDDFFQLGGHSLNGMQIIWEINQLMKTDCKLDDIFRNSQFKSFLVFLDKLEIKNEADKSFRNLENYTITDNSGKLKCIPLSYPQENMYILRQLQHPTLYNICFLIKFQGLVCTKSVRKSLLFLIAKQTSLRTTFPTSNDQCYQEIQSLTESYYHISWPYISEQACCKLIDDEKNHKMDLNNIPLRILSMINAKANIEKAEYMIMISQHHIITDGWSMTIFATDLAQFYRYCLKNEYIPETFKKLSKNVTHFSTWQRSKEFTQTVQKDLQRLCTKLHGLQATRIVVQKVQESATMAEKEINQRTFPISAKLWTQISQKAKQCQQTTHTIMLAAFLCLIRKFSDDYTNNTVVIGCPVSGRTATREMKSVIGYFLNNIILVVKDLKINAPSSVLLQQISEAFQDARSFEHVPFHLLVAKIITYEQRNIHQHPIFEIFFNYRHNLEFPRIEISNVRSTITQLTTNNAFNFACTIDETDDETLVTFDYNARYYSSQLINEMSAVYLKFLTSISRKCDSKTSNWFTDLEYRSYLDVSSRTLINIIEQQSKLTNKLIAFNQTFITYGELYRMIYIFSYQIEQFYLQNNGESIRPDTVIPICADSDSIIVSLLAVQLTGAAYAPIDPANCYTKILQLVQYIGASIIIVQEDNLSLDIPTIQLTKLQSLTKISDKFKLDYFLQKSFGKQRLQSFDAAYIIFTSGSTGKPKAVCVTHRNLLNFVHSSTAQTKFRPKFRIYHSVNVTFDVSCLNIFTTFANGSCLVSSGNILNAVSEIVHEGIQFAFLPSALFNMFDDNEIHQLERLEKLYVGGESPNSQQLQRCLQIGISIRQIYGPTETTIWSLSNSCSVQEYDCGRVIGTAMENETVYLVDAEKSRTCRGAKGELVICGEGVSRGYLNQEADSFMRIKFHHTREDQILNRNMFCYYTGDIAMQLGNKYHFLGRKDGQLKVRGYRVEPREIEIAAAKWNLSVRNSIVLKNDRLESLFLFVEDETGSICSENLREHLKQELLHFMVPEKIIVLRKMPLNRNGKLSISCLKKIMEENEFSANKRTTAWIQTDEVLSKRVKEIWCQVLGVIQHEASSNFFKLGGHSLLLVLLRNKLRDEFKFNLSFEQFYCQPTLEALIHTVKTEMNSSNRIVDRKQMLNFQIYDDHTNLIDPCLDCKPKLESQNSLLYSTSKLELKFVNLRETTASNGNLYLIHAIAGAVYSYFGLISTIPQGLNIYAIEYEFHYPSNSLMELASFYSKQIAKHSTEMDNGIYLMGHSLGGILAREIAQLLCDDSKKEVSFVIMLDSWSIGTGTLDVNTVKCYLQERLAECPGKEEYIKKSEMLTKLLQKHQFSISSIKIYLLKAKKHENSPLRSTLRELNGEKQTGWLISNGWQKYSTKKVDIFLVDGDHDSMLQPQNIIFLNRIFAYIYSENGIVKTYNNFPSPS
uniref:Fatty acid synthase n=1 Tax=Setaria digitata TaxID=48799 RepID=A0A915Q055_9BILA